MTKPSSYQIYIFLNMIKLPYVASYCFEVGLAAS